MPFTRFSYVIPGLSGRASPSNNLQYVAISDF
jgi:hypothetical protein